MFDGHLQQGRFVDPLRGGVGDPFAFEAPVEPFANLVIVPTNLFESRPVRRLVVRQAPADGVDSKRQQFVELRMERLQVEGVSRQKIPIEGFQVADVENDPVPLRDRALVK